MIVEVEQISLGTIEVEVLGPTPLVFDVYAGTPLSTEVVLVEVGQPGPPGPQGPAGDLSTYTIGQLLDVDVTTPAEGDTLVYTSNKFRNRPGLELVDGGNF